jgi:mannosyltransferase OCH1-like enzyme
MFFEARPNLFQFWDKPEPSDEVSVLMASWEADPDFVYRRFDANSAAAYIAEHFGDRAVAAYRECAVPAMQADFFRYCALYHEGGVYVDADTANSGKLPGFIAEAGRGILMNRQQKIANDFLFVREAGDPLFEKVVAQAIENVEQRISNNVWLVTGPGIMTHMHLDPERRPWFDGFEIRPAREVREIVLFRHELVYKTTGEDWRSNLSAGAPSIFRTPGE